MRIETTIQPKYLWWNLLYAILCVALGAWGAYDYWVTIPAREEAAKAYEAAQKVKADLAAQAALRSLTAEESVRYGDAEAVLAAFANAPPSMPPAYDRPLQLWVYFVGCGIVSAPWFLANIVLTRGRRYILEEDGTLLTPTGRFAPSDMTDIDMSRWMSKSIAVVQVTGGMVKLDDYKHAGIARIVAVLAQRFHPGKWTDEPRPVEDSSEAEPQGNS